jgi:hypothetical protein
MCVCARGGAKEKRDLIVATLLVVDRYSHTVPG